MHSDHLETRLAHFGEDRASHSGAVVPPIYQNSLFTFESWDAIDRAFDDRVEHPIYTRGTNPTVRAVERKLASIAGAPAARLFASGMAAISAAVLHSVDPGDHVVTIRNVYGPTQNLLGRYLRDKMNLEVTFVDGTDPADFERAATDRTRLFYLESPSSAVFSLQDLAAVARIARARGIRTIADNTWATPLFQKPLELGIDLEVHSVSKYLGGHSDLVSGALLGSEEDIRSIAVTEVELLGGIMAPFEAWLLQRSLRTLPMRMERHQANAAIVARFLEAHPGVSRVRWPGLESHPQHGLARRQMTGCSGLMGFTLATDDLPAIKRFFDELRLFQRGVSWGGHESLVYAPAISYLKELPPERFAELGISLGDMRISVGLEDAGDLVQDLDRALALVG
jgi:cystathionine beta-lyase/cystathionine gamma-synthase